MDIFVNDEKYIPQRVFCIGQNYLDHINEMNSQKPDNVVVFMKPPTSLVRPGEKVRFPTHGDDFHYEAEVVVLIGKDGYPTHQKDAENYVSGLSLGLDLTMRDVQTSLRKKGLPWEASKAFDQSSPVGNFVPKDDIHLQDIPFKLKVNDKISQDSNTDNMIFSIGKIIYELSKLWKLKKGDLIYTGTPSGVGELTVGDIVEIESPLIGTFSWEIVE